MLVILKFRSPPTLLWLLDKRIGKHNYRASGSGQKTERGSGKESELPVSRTLYTRFSPGSRFYVLFLFQNIRQCSEKIFLFLRVSAATLEIPLDAPSSSASSILPAPFMHDPRVFAPHVPPHRKSSQAFLLLYCIPIT